MQPWQLFIAALLPGSAYATNFHNTGNFQIWVQDSQANNHEVSAKGSVAINGGWAFVWADSTSGKSKLICPGTVFTWPSGYNDVYWSYATFNKPSILHDAGGNNIGQSHNQICSV